MSKTKKRLRFQLRVVLQNAVWSQKVYAFIYTHNNMQRRHLQKNLPIYYISSSTPSYIRDAGYMQICDRIAYFAKTHISHTFPHIMAFSESHMQKLCRICKNLHIFAYMPRISAYAIAFFSIFLVQHCFKTVKYFWQQMITSIYN